MFINRTLACILALLLFLVPALPATSVVSNTAVVTRNKDVVAAVIVEDAPVKTVVFPEKEPLHDPLRAESIQCLAQNMYFEARGEPLNGQLAVAFVTINRVRSRHYPSTICGVVGQKSRGICQFSWKCDSIPDVPRDKQLFAGFTTMAEWVYDFHYKQEILPDISQGSTHFHTVNVSPGWAGRLERRLTIGRHIFYAM